MDTVALVCSNCANKLKEEDKFCSTCGKAVYNSAVQVLTNSSESAITYHREKSQTSSTSFDGEWRAQVEEIIDKAVHNVDEIIGDLETSVKFGRLTKPEYTYYLGYVEGIMAERIGRILVVNRRTSPDDERWLKAVYDNRKSYEILKAIQKSEQVKMLIKKSHVV